MKILVVNLLFLVLMTSCRSVSRNQLNELHRFAGKTAGFSAFPETIMQGIAEIRESRGVWYAASFTDPQQHISELNAIVRERIGDEKIPGRIKIVFRILDEYSKGLSVLSSDIPFKSQAILFENLGADLDLLTVQYNRISGDNPLPTGVGAVLTKSMSIASGVLLANRQLKLLKGFVTRADTLVAEMCDKMIIFLSAEGLSHLIEAEETGIQESFRFYYTKIPNAPVRSDKDYILLMKRVGELKELRNLTIRVAGNLKIAHKMLKINLQRKKNLTEVAACLFKFYLEMDELNHAFSRMKLADHRLL